MLGIIFSLFIMAFIIGTEKFIMIGIIQYVATDLNISLVKANYLSSI